MTALEALAAAGAAVDELRGELLNVEGIGDLRVGVGHYLDPKVWAVELLLSVDDARLLAAELRHARNDVVDRVEIAVVVETIGEIHAAVRTGESRPEREVVCAADDEPFPCRTRTLLTQLPGGAL